MISLCLICALVFVNGWTDAPNAIATAVGCGALKMRQASLMAAVMNLLGLATAYLTSGRIVDSMQNIVSLDTDTMELAINVASVGVVLWAVAAWYFGLPTSESHAVVASLCGSAVAAVGTINKGELSLVLVGLITSLALGFASGWLIGYIGERMPIREKTLKKAVITSSALMAFSHGAQDGQKLLGMMLLSLGSTAKEINEILPPALVAALMFLGTSVGGKRIVEKVGSLTRLSNKTAFCADLGGAACVLASTFLGIPLSTTHSKTSAIMGVAAAGKRMKWQLGRDMLVAWLLTFPLLFLFGYFFTLILI